MDKSGCAQISGHLGKIIRIFAKNRVDSARIFTIKSPDEKLVILAVSQFWKFSYGTGDIGKFLKGDNFPNFCDHIS